jgi:hypothetical protein
MPLTARPQLVLITAEPLLVGLRGYTFVDRQP